MSEYNTMRFIITWKKKSPLGYDFIEDEIYDTEDEAKLALEELSDEDTVYTIREVSDVFLYLYANLGNSSELTSFTDDEDDLKKVYDFLENVRDEEFVKEYLCQSQCSMFHTFDRKKWLQRKIDKIENMMK